MNASTDGVTLSVSTRSVEVGLEVVAAPGGEPDEEADDQRGGAAMNASTSIVISPTIGRHQPLRSPAADPLDPVVLDRPGLGRAGGAGGP